MCRSSLPTPFIHSHISGRCTKMRLDDFLLVGSCRQKLNTIWNSNIFFLLSIQNFFSSSSRSYARFWRFSAVLESSLSQYFLRIFHTLRKFLMHARLWHLTRSHVLFHGCTTYHHFGKLRCVSSTMYTYSVHLHCHVQYLCIKLTQMAGKMNE